MKAIILSSILITSSVNLKLTKIDLFADDRPLMDYHEEFDQVKIPPRTTNIAKMITALRPKFSKQKKYQLASKIQKISKEYKLEPQIIVAIIDAESEFDQNKISDTGDLSLAQINPDVWNEEFKRLNLEELDIERLKTDTDYSLKMMGKILSHLKKNYGHKDRKWYARYHSKNKKYKEIYLSKLNHRLKKMRPAHYVL